MVNIYIFLKRLKLSPVKILVSLLIEVLEYYLNLNSCIGVMPILLHSDALVWLVQLVEIIYSPFRVVEWDYL